MVATLARVWETGKTVDVLANVATQCCLLLIGKRTGFMSDPQKPDRRLQSADSQRQQAGVSRDTSRPADSIPTGAGQFANLPAMFGRYQVEKLLGRGAMGAVYLARDTQLGRAVALKIPKVAPSGSKRLLLRLETEAKAAAQLDHPSLCKVFDAGEVDGQCFIAMQYIEGETLKSQLEAKSKSVAEAVSLVVQLAEGLSEAHAQGIIHRDLKPENIMINLRGTPVIMDFGLAKFSTISSNAMATQAGTILGSPAYMSPEQANGQVKEIDQRSDIYALGTILFEMLTGELPFTGSAMQILGQKSLLDPTATLTIRPDLHPDLTAICDKMIAKDSAQRYQTLAEVIADLKGVDLDQTDDRPGPVAKRKPGKSASGSRKSRVGPTTFPQRLLGWWNDQTSAVKWLALGGVGALLLTLGIFLFFPNQNGIVQIAPIIGKPDVGANGVQPKGLATDSVRNPKTEAAGNVEKHKWPADGPPPALVPFNSAQAKVHQAAWAKYMGVKVVEQNSIGMNLVLIPPGQFKMGSPLGEIDRIDDEEQVSVTLPQSIQVGETEVTQGQWSEIMATKPWTGKEKIQEGSDYPATFVNVDDAEQFCTKLGTKEGAQYRLLTEAEWEFCCRAGTLTRFSFGDDAALLKEFAWYDDGVTPLAEGYAHQVGTKKANPFGLHDMHGNVWEWCQDWYDEKLPGGDNPLVSTSSEHRVYRGGCQFHTADFCRSAFRGHWTPELRGNNLGFRVARVLHHGREGG
ncbi:MAG: prkC 29 [Planctomycetaceae bacterium]|nr:prkC 29 [Planctomycetaceae bacterium]